MLLHLCRTGRTRHRVARNDRLVIEMEIVVQAISPDGSVYFGTDWRRANADDRTNPPGLCERHYAADMLATFGEGWRAR